VCWGDGLSLVLCYPQIAGEYRWSSGWPVHFTAWGFNEPSRADGEGCVAMSRNGTWDDTDCSLQLPALCEITSGLATSTDSSLIVIPSDRTKCHIIVEGKGLAKSLAGLDLLHD